MRRGRRFPAPERFDLREATLDRLAETIDAEGGVASVPRSGQWKGVSYQPSFRVDEDLDPFSEAYVAQQERLYREIAGRPVDQQENELCAFPMDWHVRHLSAYGTNDVAFLASHHARLSRLAFLANLPPGARVLDLGAGWGLSSEILASLGCRVTAVDINPDFVELINRRAARLGNGVAAAQATFETVDAPGKFDAVVFYECLHHAIRPWVVIERAARLLAPGGKICFAAEPENSLWWRHWGLRLDPVSVYCIRKFGWFESGWSPAFLAECFRRAGLALHHVPDSHPLLGPVGLAERRAHRVLAAAGPELAAICRDGWIAEGATMVATGESTLVLPSEPADILRLRLANHHGRPLRLSLGAAGERARDFTIEAGPQVIDIDLHAAREIVVTTETWSPAAELGSPDERRIAFHLDGVELWRDETPPPGVESAMSRRGRQSTS